MSTEKETKKIEVVFKGIGDSGSKIYQIENAFLHISGIPWNDTQSVIEPSETNGVDIKTIVKYTRPDLDAIYGSKSKKLDLDVSARAKVEEYLQEFFKMHGEDSKKSDGYENFEQWLHFQTLKRVSTVLLPGVCKSEVLRLVKTSLGDTIDNLESKVDAGEVDKDEVKRLEALLARAKQGVKKTASESENVA